MKNKMNLKGMLILIVLFLLFYFVANYFLAKEIDKDKQEIDNSQVISPAYENEKKIVENLYSKVKILYDVVNNKFKVSQDDVIILGDITYKKITNFEEVMVNFTSKGIDKYIKDMGSFFAYYNGEYYLAGNLVTYQTYYFRGDNTNIYIIDADDEKIEGIIYEKWKSNNRNTLATIEVVKDGNDWLINRIDILSSE